MQHSDLLVKLIKPLNLAISEYSFANLYLFRDIHSFGVLTGERCVVFGKTRSGADYIMPMFKPEKGDLAFLKGLAGRERSIFPVPEEWLSVFPAGECEASFLDCDSDYIFTTEKMSQLKGGRLHKKRNLLKQFVEAYAHEAVPLTADRTGDALKILDKWQADSGEQSSATDYGPCAEALKLMEKLKLCGAIIYADNEPAGFLLGEEIHGGDMYALHFGKGDKKFKGLYQYMYNSFSKILPGKYKFINIEQDMCNPALRLSKSSYQPDMMAKKYSVRFI